MAIDILIKRGWIEFTIGDTQYRLRERPEAPPWGTYDYWSELVLMVPDLKFNRLVGEAARLNITDEDLAKLRALDGFLTEYSRPVVRPTPQRFDDDLPPDPFYD